jgi:exopolysaccharide production protein ExoZ
MQFTLHFIAPGMTNKKIQSIQALRGAAVLLVLARHIYVMEGHFGGGVRVIPGIAKAGDGGVDIFFVISGFIMVMISRGQFQIPGALRSFLYRRAVRIYPLYWVYTLVVIAVFFVAPALVPAMHRGEVDIFDSFLLVPQLVMPVLGQGWTLVHEAYFYLVFALALLLPERRLLPFLIVWGLAVAAGYNIYVNHVALLDNATIKLITHPLTIEFVLGACVALAIRRGWRHGDWLCLIGGCLLLPASSFFFDPLDFEGLRLFCFGLPALLILYGAVSLESRSRFQFPMWMRGVGDASYSIYLSHILVISGVGRICSAVFRPGLFNNALACLIMAAAAIGVGYASYRWLERPLLRALQTWQPRRNPAPISPGVGIVSK